MFEVQKYAKTLDSKVLKTKNGKTVLSSKCAVCNSANLTFMKKQEAKGILSSLGLETPLNKIPLLGETLL